MSDLRTLTVVVIEAKDVIACDKGKSSDPYCKLDLVDGKTAKAISGEVSLDSASGVCSHRFRWFVRVFGARPRQNKYPKQK